MSGEKRHTRATAAVDWSEIVRTYRQTHNLKQAALAVDLGVTQAMISRWENGSLEPGPDHQLRILELRDGSDVSSPMVHWRSYIRELPSIAAILTPRAEIETASTGLLRLLGSDRSRLEKRPLADLFEGDLLHLHQSLKATGFFDERVETVESADMYRFRLPDGSWREVAMHCEHWWRRGEDSQPRWVLSGAQIDRDEFDRLRTEMGGQYRVIV